MGDVDFWSVMEDAACWSVMEEVEFWSAMEDAEFWSALEVFIKFWSEWFMWRHYKPNWLCFFLYVKGGAYSCIPIYAIIYSVYVMKVYMGWFKLQLIYVIFMWLCSQVTTVSYVHRFIGVALSYLMCPFQANDTKVMK